MDDTSAEVIGEEVEFDLAVDPSVPKIETAATAPNALLGGLIPAVVPDTSSFRGLAWQAHKLLWGCKWDRKGGFFSGRLAVEYAGPGQYVYRPDKDDPFRFQRWNGTRVTPGLMRTDGASVPRVLWSVPGFAATDYLPAAVLHDWLFVQHTCDPENGWSFEEANLVLAEAMFTMMTAGGLYTAPENWKVVVAYYAAVSSLAGRRVWSRTWTDEEKRIALNL